MLQVCVLPLSGFPGFAVLLFYALFRRKKPHKPLKPAKTHTHPKTKELYYIVLPRHKCHKPTNKKIFSFIFFPAERNTHYSGKIKPLSTAQTHKTASLSCNYF